MRLVEVWAFAEEKPPLKKVMRTATVKIFVALFINFILVHKMIFVNVSVDNLFENILGDDMIL